MTDTRNLDLNLLLVLRAVLKEQSLARGARKLGMSERTVRRALARASELLGDPLLERGETGYALTRRAEELFPLIDEAAKESERTFDILSAFDPAQSTRRFLVSASDYVLSELANPLLSIFAREAPHARLEFDTPPMSNFLAADLLLRDVRIFPRGRNMAGKHLALFSDAFVCLADASNPGLRDGSLSLEEILSTRVVSLVSPMRWPTNVDDALAEVGYAPRSAVTVRSLLAMPFVIAGTPWIGWVPERVARRFAPRLGLVIAETPIAPRVLVEEAYWHPSRTNDPARQWLVRKLREASARVEFGSEVARLVVGGDANATRDAASMQTSEPDAGAVGGVACEPVSRDDRRHSGDIIRFETPG